MKVPALAPHKVFPGNRPSTTLVYPTLDPATLGRIIALYEHRVFVEGVIWGINSLRPVGGRARQGARHARCCRWWRAARLRRQGRLDGGAPGDDHGAPGLRCSISADRPRCCCTPTAQLLVYDKPSGLLSVPAKLPGPADCLEARARAAFPEALLVHRLDRDTRG